MAYGYLALALALAVSLNAANRFVRAGGTLLAALALSMIAVSIVAADFDGTFTAMPPPSSPLDPFKPLILNIQAAMAAVAAAFFFRAALLQLQRPLVKSAPLLNTPSGFGIVSRYAHWITATLILCLVPMGLFVSVLKAGSPDSEGYLAAHQSLGLTIFTVAVFRLLWLRFSPPPEQPTASKLWERHLARLVHVGLYVLILAFPVSGFLMSAFSGQEMQFFGWFFQPIATADKEAARIWIAIHDLVLPSAFYVLILAHIGGVMKHHFWDRRTSDVRRMVA
jgi:cytochrome b561